MIIDELFEGPQQCPECGGISFSDLILAEKKDACYYKVKASAKVWPSAYASGRLVQCRKKGAANYGNKSESVAEGKKKSDTYHIVNKDGKPASLASYADKESAVKDRDAKHQGAEVRQLGPRGKVKSVAEGYVPINIYKGPTNPAPEPKKVEPEHKYVDNRVEVEKHYQARANLFYNVVTKSDGKVINPEPIKGLRAAEEFMKQNGLSRANADIKQVWPEEQELDEKWSQKYKSSINCANPKGFSQKAHCAGRNKNEDVTENAVPQLTVPQLAAISDEALDNAYHYGRSTPGNTFGYQANLKSAAYAKQMIDQGVTDIEAISDAIHKGWNTTAQAFVQNPDQFDDTAKLAAAGKLEAKLQQRAQLMKQNYAQLPEEEKEKDRVVARALLQAIRGPQQPGVAEGNQKKPKEVDYDDEYDAMVARVKKLAGLGPMKTVYDPTKRQYRNMPTAVQPKK